MYPELLKVIQDVVPAEERKRKSILQKAVLRLALKLPGLPVSTKLRFRRSLIKAQIGDLFSSLRKLSAHGRADSLEAVAPDAKINRGPEILQYASVNATYFADRRWLRIEVQLQSQESDRVPVLTFSSGRTSTGLAVSLQQSKGTVRRWIFEGLSAGVLDKESVIAEIPGERVVRSSPQPIKVENPNKPPVVTIERDPSLSSISTEDLEDLAKNTPNRISVREREGSNDVALFPDFKAPEDLANHYFRAVWYLTGPAGQVRRCTIGTSLERPNLRPAGFAEVTSGRPDIVELISDEADYFERVSKARLILVWKTISDDALRAMRQMLPGAEILPVATEDPTSVEFGNYARANWQALTPDQRTDILQQSKRRLGRAIESCRSRGLKKAVVFGTGPSIDHAFDYDFRDCLTIVCNTAVSDPALLAHVRPEFVCAGDAVSHMGVSEYAGQFRSDLCSFILRSDAWFVTTARLGYVIAAHHPEIAERIILIEQITDDPVTDLEAFFALPRLDSTLNIHMLPLAATVAKTIYFLGCDGKNPDVDKNEDFWAHSPRAHYHELVDTGHLCHPTFNARRQIATHARFLDSTERSCVEGEIQGKRYFALRPSHTPALKARPVPGSFLKDGGEGKIALRDTPVTAVPSSGRRICLVMRAPHALFSGGRYHALLLAEALGSLGDDVVVWTNNYPSWLNNLTLQPAHYRLQLHVNPFSEPPAGDFDVVIIVPDMSADSTPFEKALTLARDTGAITSLINFETPNWFNELAKIPRDPAKWRFWKAMSSHVDAIVSSAEAAVGYAKDYYTTVSDSCEFAAVPPSINTPIADLVRARDLQPENQIICISRFGTGSEHKNIRAMTSLLSDATRGHTLALIVGTADLPDGEEIDKLRAAFAAHDVKLKLLHKISDIEKFEQIARSKCMVFPTLFEGFGYPPIEALYMGRPCIAYDLPVLREFSDGLTTFVPRGDITAMRSALASMITKPQTEPRRLHEGISQVASGQRFAQDIDSLFARMLVRPSRAASNFEADEFRAKAAEIYERERLNKLTAALAKGLPENDARTEIAAMLRGLAKAIET
ncbi:glycosyltransferase [Ruegeria lacuscaerulensis]|uniref:glycosyltransferase n=1 Tax=Ruegeria lacuscaerulensis TaxID=55218 RepID=UPI001480F2ED|nr:glycosyltransferase [Ruegeria lacuscaerulensis]